MGTDDGAPVPGLDREEPELGVDEEDIPTPDNAPAVEEETSLEREPDRP
ncbi:MAG: hypothetical protein AVDCRST_MAG51-1210 [uncultured Ramlibacter sp.]|uniref:Uncharacterized protein n=1 Tax=uncultured Ramlibacter sp. TaxID=260755 RepID=A0A6J4P6F2_9BURK|nr:MAG: hypothetical protein AVDCRST_MAG51-1210 [uncultured Ramlibacter sp.]